CSRHCRKGSTAKTWPCGCSRKPASAPLPAALLVTAATMRCGSAIRRHWTILSGRLSGLFRGWKNRTSDEVLFFAASCGLFSNDVALFLQAPSGHLIHFRALRHNEIFLVDFHQQQQAVGNVD